MKWKYQLINILAETPAEVEKYISDKYTQREYRGKVYTNKDEDSLVIKERETITFPYVEYFQHG